MRSALLLLSFAGLSAAQAPLPLNQRTPPERFDGVPKDPLPDATQYRVRLGGKNPNQVSILKDRDEFSVAQIVLTPSNYSSEFINDLEREMEIMAYIHEKALWGNTPPPTGWTIGQSRIPRPKPQGRKKRSIQKKIKKNRGSRAIEDLTPEDVGRALLAIAQKTTDAHKNALKTVKNSTVYKEVSEAIDEILKSEAATKKKREAVQVPKTVRNWLDLGVYVVKRMREEGIVDAVEHTAKELSQAYEEEKHRVEKELVELSKQNDFAELVFDREAERRYDELMGAALRKNAVAEAELALASLHKQGDRQWLEAAERRRKRQAPFVTLHGTYRLVPKKWGKEEMEVAYSGMMKVQRKKRDEKVFREFVKKLGL